MATDPNSWGPLGDPSAAQVQAWCDLPVGEFSRMVKGLRKTKNKMQTMRVQVTRKTIVINTSKATVDYHGVVDSRGSIKDFASQVMSRVRDGSLELEWSEPSTHSTVEYSYRRV